MAEFSGICGLGISFTWDGFRILYGLIAAFMWLMAAVFGKRYFAGHGRMGRYRVCTLLTLAAVEGLFFSADFFTAFLFFEMMSLTSYVWVAQEESGEALRAADTYLGIAVIGGLVMLMGMFLLKAAAGTLEFEAVGRAAGVLEEKAGFLGEKAGFSGEMAGVSGPAFLAAGGNGAGGRAVFGAAAACMLVGFGAKAGMFPLHVWLPKAHAVAPAPASALLSGILTKAGVFGILLVTVYLMAGNRLWGGWLLGLGLVTMVLGAVLALFSNQLKRTLACSSMSQIGFILVGISAMTFLGNHGELAVRGTLLHMVNHSLLKLLLFMAAGVVVENTGKLELDEIRGFGRNKPFFLLVFLMGALGISGVPGWNGYVSKTLLHEALIEVRELAAAAGGDVSLWRTAEVLFLLAGGLTAAYMMKLFAVLFLERHPGRQAEFDAMGSSYLDGRQKFSLGLAAVLPPLLGMFPYGIMDRAADAGQGFLRVSEGFAPVKYFSAENLCGAAVSLAAGGAVYVLAVRLWMTVREADGSRRYPDRWPRWMDLETYVYRPVILKALPAVCLTVCRAMDQALDGIILLARSTTHRQTREKYRRLKGDRAAYILGVAVDDAVLALRKILRKKGSRASAIPRLVELEESLLKTGGIIGTSLSFSLMLVCAGLCLTLLYLVFWA